MPSRNRLPLALAIPVLGLLASCAPVRSGPSRPGVATLHAWDTVAYNQRAILACHNCYERTHKFPRFDAAMDVVRAVEIDIWRAPNAGEWVVSHHAKVTSDSNCAPSPEDGDLARCLEIIGRRLAREPSADPLTVFVDVKNSFQKRRWTVGALDALLARTLGRARIFTPKELRDLQPAAPGGAAPVWPSMGSLHGRVIVVLTGDAKYVEKYREAGDATLAFIAENASHPADVDRILNDPDAARRAFFFNVGITDNPLEDGEAARRVATVRRAAAASRAARLWQYDFGDRREADDEIRAAAACAHHGGELTFLAVYLTFAPVPATGCAARSP